MLNKYFNNFGNRREQDFIDDLVVESIKQYGIEVKYIPRTIINEDTLFGEDVLSRFSAAHGIEMYIKNIEGFEGEGEFLSKFNLEIRDQMTLVVARRRWNQIRVGNSLTDEVGFKYIFESANTKNQSSDMPTTEDTGVIILEAGTAGSNVYSITASRPMEGDLIYFPLSQNIFEIKFVEHETVFYQFGRLQTFELRCNLFEYSSEKINTGNTEIDAIETRSTLDILQYQYSLEDDSGVVVLEGDSDDDFLIQEFRIEAADPVANNELFQIQSQSILDFSENNPFSEAGNY